MSKPQPFRSSSMSALDSNAAAPDFEARPHAPKRSLLSSGWSAVRKMRIVPKQGARHQSGAAQQNSSQRSMAYVNAGAQYVRQVSGMLKDKVSSLRHSALAAEVPQGIARNYAPGLNSFFINPYVSRIWDLKMTFLIDHIFWKV